MPQTTKALNPRTTFWKCGACSHAMFHLINNDYSNNKDLEEKASDLLAGGIAQKGHQCGMLWGASLAAGTESFRKNTNKDKAVANAIIASRHLINSFFNRTKTVNCRDISKVDWENKLDFAIYMIKIIFRGFVFSPCFNLIVKWTPEAKEAVKKGLQEDINIKSPCLSCASEVVKQLGGTDEEAVMVAGFAGGIGLSGNACGALAATIWYKMLEFSKQDPKNSPTMNNNPEAKKILRTFYIQTDSEVLCTKITGKQFKSPDEHSQFIQSGGCKNIINALASIN